MGRSRAGAPEGTPCLPMYCASAAHDEKSRKDRDFCAWLHEKMRLTRAAVVSGAGDVGMAWSIRGRDSMVLRRSEERCLLRASRQTEKWQRVALIGSAWHCVASGWTMYRLRPKNRCYRPPHANIRHSVPPPGRPLRSVGYQPPQWPQMRHTLTTTQRCPHGCVAGVTHIFLRCSFISLVVA